MVVICAICGADITITKTRYNKSKTKEFTCSRECRSKLTILNNLNCECEICGKKFHRKKSQLEKIKNPTCSTKCSARLKSKIYSGEGNPNFNNTGESNPLYKGERIYQRDGYILTWVGHDHPFARQGRIREHRLIAERELMEDWQSVEVNGVKYLSPEFEVHHINHKKDDNRVENLMIVTKDEHMRIHQEDRHKDGIYRVMKPCPICGEEFDVNDYYRLNNKKTCSDKCLQIYEERNKVQLKQERRCLACDKRLPSATNQKTCSLECSYKLRGLSPKQEVKCESCGKLFKAKPSRINKVKKLFCSRECYYSFKRNSK